MEKVKSKKSKKKDKELPSSKELTTEEPILDDVDMQIEEYDGAIQNRNQLNNESSNSDGSLKVDKVSGVGSYHSY